MASYNNKIDITLRADSNIGELRANDVFVQDSTNRILEITIIDRNNKLLVSDQAKITVYVIWNPKRDINKRLINPQGFELKPDAPDYDITIIPMKDSDGADYSIIRVPFRKEYVHSAGDNIMILKIENINDEGTTVYTTSLVYNVQQNDAYNVQLPSTLPTYDNLLKMLANKVNLDFSNLSDVDVVKAKEKLGVGNAETGEQIVAQLEKLTGDKRLSYKNLKDTPTIPKVTGFANKDLSNLSDDDVAKAKAKLGVGNLETPVEIREALKTLKDKERLPASAIEGLPIVPDVSGFANKSLDNVNDVTFKRKGENAGLLTTDLGNVDDDGFNEKINKSDLAKTVGTITTNISNKANKDLSNVDPTVLAGLKDNGEQIAAKLSGLEDDKKLSYNDLKDKPTIPSGDLSNIAKKDLTNVDKDVFEAKMLETDTGKDVSTALIEVDKRALIDLSNVPTQTMSDKIRLTEAYKEVIKRTGTDNHLFTYLEEQSAVADWSTVPEEKLIMAYQFTAENQRINQVLPQIKSPSFVVLSDINGFGKVIIVKNILAGHQGCTLTLTPPQGATINGASTPITLTEDGIQGILIPDAYGYEWIPYPVLHDLGIKISDDKGNVYLGEKNILFKDATLSMDDGDVVVTPDVKDNTITFVDDEGREFAGKKIQSLDKKIRISNMGNGLVDLDIDYSPDAEGLFGKLVYRQPINTDFKDQKLYFTPAYNNTEKYIGTDINDKGFTLQEGDMKDPNITGGSLFHLGMFFEPDGNPIATDDGYIELKLIDILANDYALDTDGNPIGVRREYKQGQVIRNEILLSSIIAKGQRRYAFEITASFGGQIIEASGNTSIYIQLVDKNNLTGVAEMMFQLNSGYRIHTETRYYGMNFMNLAQALVRAKGEEDLDNQSEFMGNGLFIDSRTKCKVSISDYHITMKDNGIDLPVFSLGKIFDKIDTYELRNKVLNAKVTIQDKNCAFDYALVKWTGKGEAKLPILTGFQNVVTPTFASGWEVVSKKFITEDAVSGDHVDTNAFTVPADAEQVAIIIYPIVSQTPVTMILKDFEVDVATSFNKTIITNTSHISEEHLVFDRYAYRSIVKTPNGLAGYRYTVKATDTRIPVGVFSGGDGKIVNNNAWSDIGSDDPNKTQGDIKFLTDGEVEITYEAQIYNEQGSINDVIFWLAKVNTDGSFTEVPNSKYSTTIEANRVAPKTFTSNKFTMKVKANETYRMFAKSNKDDGFYLQSGTNGIPLFRLDYYFNELETINQDVLDQLERATEIRFIENGKEISGKVAEIDVKTGKITVVDK